MREGPVKQARVRRSAGPSPLGELRLLLGKDGCTYARWTPHAGTDSDLGRLAAAAAVEWAVRSTLADAGPEATGWGTRAVRMLLERLCASVSGAVHGRRVGAPRLVGSAPPVGTVGPSVVLRVGEHPGAAFAFDWVVPAACQDLASVERTLAGLWMLAEEHGQGEVVHHALYALRGGFERSGPFPAEAAEELVGSLLLFAADMHATDLRAVQSRARLRVL